VVSFVLARAHRSAAFARRVVCAVVDIRGGRDGSETAAGANGWDPLVSDSALAFRPLDPRKFGFPASVMLTPYQISGPGRIVSLGALTHRRTFSVHRGSGEHGAWQTKLILSPVTAPLAVSATCLLPTPSHHGRPRPSAMNSGRTAGGAPWRGRGRKLPSCPRALLGSYKMPVGGEQGRRRGSERRKRGRGWNFWERPPRLLPPPLPSR
jgi:hypothetical protein